MESNTTTGIEDSGADPISWGEPKDQSKNILPEPDTGAIIGKVEGKPKYKIAPAGTGVNTVYNIILAIPDQESEDEDETIWDSDLEKVMVVAEPITLPTDIDATTADKAKTYVDRVTANQITAEKGQALTKAKSLCRTYELTGRWELIKSA